MPEHGSKPLPGSGQGAQSHNPNQSTIVPERNYQGNAGGTPKGRTTTEDHAIGGTGAGKPPAGPGAVIIQGKR